MITFVKVDRRGDGQSVWINVGHIVAIHDTPEGAAVVGPTDRLVVTETAEEILAKLQGLNDR